MQRRCFERPSISGAAAITSAAMLLAGAAGPAGAAVNISAAPTKNMICSGGVCTPDGPNANLNITDLENDLAASNLKITTNGAKAKDIHVNAALSWVSGNTLMLDAYRSIAVNAAVADMGSGGLTLTTNDGGTGGNLLFAHRNITLLSLTDSLTINGAAYTLVGNLATLASDIKANSAGNYALANPYNAGSDGTYAHPPIPAMPQFLGTFEGLGNSISNLKIVDTSDQYVGLFAYVGFYVGQRGEVRDLALTAVDISLRPPVSPVSACSSAPATD